MNVSSAAGGFGFKIHVPSRTDTSQDQDSKPVLSSWQQDGASWPPAATTSDSNALEDVRSKGMVIWDRLTNLRDSTNPARLLHTEFMHLPSAEIYYDYYQLIGDKAIAFDNIKTKLDRYEYRSLADVKADFAQCFDNAKKYNQKGSQIYLDAKKLKKTLRSIYAQITGQVEAPDPGDEDDVVGGPSNAATQPASGPLSLDSTSVLLPANIPGTSYATRGPTIKPWLNRKIAETMALADKATGRFLAEQFRTLPSKAEWPEYYRAINRPMTFDQIQTRNHRRNYVTVQGFVDDVNLLLQNALTFHQQGSQPWNDAKLLQMHFTEVMKETPPDFLPPRKYNTAKRRAEGPETGADSPQHSKRSRRDDSQSVPPDHHGRGHGDGDGSDDSDSDSDSYDGDSVAPGGNGSVVMDDVDTFGLPLPPQYDGVDAYGLPLHHERSVSATPALASPSAAHSLPPPPPLTAAFSALGDSGAASASPPVYSPYANGSTPPAPVMPDISKPQLVAKLSTKQLAAPSISAFIITTVPPSQTLTLDNDVARQHTVPVPLGVERVEITPVLRTGPQLGRQLNGANGYGAHEPPPNVTVSARPLTMSLTDDVTRAPDGTYVKRYSVVPRVGFAVVEFVARSSVSISVGAGDEDAEVYRCFLQVS